MFDLISSKYNYEFTSVDGKSLILNGLSGTVIETPDGGLQDPAMSPEDRSVLVAHHFLHPPDEDQGVLLLKRNLGMKDDPSRLELTVSMHEECNFRCVYCTQDFRNQAFDDPLQARLLAYIGANLPPQGTLQVHYYGGEPLLAWNHLVRLDQSILAYTAQTRSNYQFFITSNGSLLTEDKIDYLARRGVSHVKVTLDGPPEVHDSRRMQAGGQATFEKIIHNVVAAAPRIPIAIRVNIDSSNLPRIPELLDILAERLHGCGTQAISLDFNIVYDGRARRLALDVTYEELHQLQRLALAAGFRLRLPPLIRFRHCKFNSPRSALVDTDGGLYVCDKKPELQADQLPELAEHPSKTKKLPVYRENARDAFVALRAECRACSVLPLCGGGCSLLALGNEAPACPPWKAHLDKHLQIHHHVHGFASSPGGGSMKSLEISRFNIFLPLEVEGYTYLLNSFTRAYAPVPTDVAKLLQSGTLPDDYRDDLVAMGALVEDASAQQAVAYEIAQDEQLSTSKLTLVLPLTQACNLSCGYCYQVIHGEFRGDSARKLDGWTDEKIQTVARFAAQQIAEVGYRELRVRWYGGEPLVRPDIFSKFTDALLGVCQSAGVPLTGHIVTNGVLLDEPKAELLRRAGVDRLEISLDGPPSSHNKLRPTAKGGDSYEAVLNGIKFAAERFPTVIFRTNVHSENVSLIEGWLRGLGDEIRNKRIFLKFKLVEGDATNRLGYDEFCQHLVGIYSAARELGLNLIETRLNTETCPAIKRSYYIIESDLRVFKCPQNLGTEYHVGAIAPDGAFLDTERLKHWVNFRVTDDASCTSCAHLPHCNGGCPYTQIMQRINRRSLQIYNRQERCCSAKVEPRTLIPRVLQG